MFSKWVLHYFYIVCLFVCVDTMSGCTCGRSSLRACAASLLSSFSPLLSTASITWSRSGSHNTAVLPCCRSCRGNTHTYIHTERCTHVNAQSCTGAVMNKCRRISEESEKSKKQIRVRHGNKDAQTKAPRIKATINTLYFRSDLILWLMSKSIQSATLL